MPIEEIDGLALTPRVRRALNVSAKAATERRHTFLATEHILLGLLADPNAIATQVLAELGAAEPARARLVGILANPGYLAGGAPEASR
jgi:ATP-dependent Clp protease ATP-binding subunit ClpA